MGERWEDFGGWEQWEHDDFTFGRSSSILIPYRVPDGPFREKKKKIYVVIAIAMHRKKLVGLLEIVHIEGACMSWLIWVTV
jgi:hypothetical protein